MPEYSGTISKGKLHCTRPDLVQKWIKRNNGLWFKMRLEIIGEAVDPKTQQQLGYYWGLLLPAVHEQLQADGFTIPIEAFGIQRDIPITKDAAHELLTALCGFVGEDGKHQRLSEMNKYQTVKFIDNVVDFAVANLGMDEEKLKAWRPES
jgi:hypothetical protein